MNPFQHKRTNIQQNNKGLINYSSEKVLELSNIIKLLVHLQFFNKTFQDWKKVLIFKKHRKIVSNKSQTCRCNKIYVVY